jgi:hypothetical protein
MLDLASVTKETFDPHVGTHFSLQLDNRATLELELFEIAPLAIHPGGKRIAFALRFRSRERGHVPQRTYQLEHAALGSFALFLVPMGPDASGMVYEAVFN